MNEKDFYSLNIGQEIYYKGEKNNKIYKLIISCENTYIGLTNLFTKESHAFSWKDIMHDCSLEEPFCIKGDCKYYYAVTHLYNNHCNLKGFERRKRNIQGWR